MRTRSIRFCGIIMSISLLMSACDTTMGASSQNSQTAPSTVTITSTQAVPSPTSRVTPTETPISDPEECADNSNALAQSALGPALASKKLPTSRPDWTFNIDVTRDQNYNPCFKLSWVEVIGNNNGGTATQAVPIFFEYGELIPSQQPQQFDSILSSERKADNTVEILYGHEGYQWVTNGITEVRITYSLSGPQLSGGEQIPSELVDLVKIDLTSFTS